jgi:ABC-type multidrug transport system ATPase subunit/ABC-type multidrug transport system permease subunit
VTWAIQTFGLSKRYPEPQGVIGALSRQKKGKLAVDRVDLAVKQGELFGLVGPNGAGKTTLIKTLCTLILPTRGAALVNGYDLSQERAIKASIGLVTSDERSFYWRLTGRKNLEFFATLHDLPPDEIHQGVGRVLDIVGLASVADSRFLTYSTGMRQRLSIARALLSQPQLLFLDEPTKGLDPLGIQALHELIRKQLVDDQGITILLTSHWLEEVEQLCDRIAIMNHGRIQAVGTMPELREALGLGEKYSLRITDFQPQMQVQLENQAAEVRIRSQADGDTLIEFEVRKNQNGLSAILETIRECGGKVKVLTNEAVSLETIFARLTGETEVTEVGEPSSDPGNDLLKDQIFSEQREKTGIQAAISSPYRPLARRLKSQLRIAWAFLKRDAMDEASYRFSFFLQFLNIFFSVGLFYFIARLLGSAASPYLEAYGGDYFAFVLVGIAFAGYFGVGLSSFSSSLRQAQTTGTLEAMLTTPTALSTIILSSSLWSYLLTTLRVLVYLLIGGVFLNVNLGGGNYFGALIVLILTIISFSSLGIIAASFIMVLKRGDPVTWLFNATSSFLGGIYYPVSILPGWLQFFSYLLPVTYALRAMRLALLQGATTATILSDVLILAVFSLLLMPASLLAFRFAVRRARVDGSLSQY